MTAKTKKTAEPRRANKPLMEKRRRARINQSLLALKTLILDSAKSENTKHSKLEKADILELTVRHFQRHRSLDTAGIRQYRAGYSDCVKEVQRYLETPDAQTMTVIEPGVRQRLIHHLENCISEVDLDLKPAGNVEERLQPPDSSTVEEINNNKNSDGVNTRMVVTNSAPQLIGPSGTNENLQNGDVYSPVFQGTSPKPICSQRLPAISTSCHSSSLICDGSSKFPVGSECFIINDVLAVPDGKDSSTRLLKTSDGNFVFLLPSHYLQLANALGINLKDYRSETRDGALTANSVKCEPEKPLDFSKNNEGDSMWRPW